MVGLQTLLQLQYAYVNTGWQNLLYHGMNCVHVRVYTLPWHRCTQLISI